MFASTMRYKFKEGKGREGSKIWNDIVFHTGMEQEGVISLQILLNEDEALAIGIWDGEEYAQRFMKTGIFIDLMNKLESILLKKPQAERWEAEAFGTVR